MLSTALCVCMNGNTASPRAKERIKLISMSRGWCSNVTPAHERDWAGMLLIFEVRQVYRARPHLQNKKVAYEKV